MTCNHARTVDAYTQTVAPEIGVVSNGSLSAPNRGGDAQTISPFAGIVRATVWERRRRLREKRKRNRRGKTDGWRDAFGCEAASSHRDHGKGSSATQFPRGLKPEGTTCGDWN
ncbi:hypothetical protein MRX96_005025 [Rhipicephalus microplus]